MALLFKTKIAKLTLALFFSVMITVNVSAAAPSFPGGLLINHNAARNFDLIPAVWIQAAKNQFMLSYEHTSHGSQLVTGMAALSAANSLYDYSDGFLCDYCITGGSDLGNPNYTAWASSTRDYLNGTGSARNAIMWSWCGEASWATETDIADSYLANMAQLENDFPNVRFIYMTGHLDGGGGSGILNLRNWQIRNYTMANNKVLYDFADIESFDPTGPLNFMLFNADDGCYYYNGGSQYNWAQQWIAAHPNSELTQLAASCGGCAHSTQLNCVMKGRAFWYMMARLAGWDGSTTCESLPARVSETATNYTTVYNAYTSSSSDKTILLQARNFNEDLNMTGNDSVTIKGGYACDYRSNPGFSSITGKMTLTAGTAIVENLIIK